MNTWSLFPGLKPGELALEARNTIKRKQRRLPSQPKKFDDGFRFSQIY